MDVTRKGRNGEKKKMLGRKVDYLMVQKKNVKNGNFS